jgi:predicted acylesterase/phospholipase RssA
MAGGGPAGAIYEIGALRALDESIEGLDLNHLCIYVGVSAGAFIAANLANNLTPVQMCRAIVKHDPGEHPFVPEIFFTPAIGELTRRGVTVPRLFLESLWRYARNPRDLSLLESLTRMSRALPVGLFDNRQIADYLARIYSIKGRTNDFRRLDKKLVIVAADLDSGKAVRFGHDGLDDVPISVAVQASTALPGLYPPVEIKGRHYVDGVLLKTMHASVALNAGAKLLLCLNPLVPVDTAEAVTEGVMRRGKLIHRGLPTVLSQAMRTLIRSRLGAGFSGYESAYPEADVILLEPPRDDYRMFFTNVFSFSSRRMICEHAYQSARRQLFERRRELQPMLERQGLSLRLRVLEDEDRSLWDGVGLGRFEPGRGVLSRLDAVLDRLEDVVDEATR